MADGLNNFFQSLSGKLGSAIGNPTAQQKPGIPTSGNVRDPFLTPNTLLSSVYVPVDGDTRTGPGALVSNWDAATYKGTLGLGGAPSPMRSLLEDRSKSASGITYKLTKSQQPGFTPINYYRSGGEVYLQLPSKLKTTKEKLDDNIYSYDKYGDDRASSFKFSLQDYVNYFGAQDGVLENSTNDQINGQVPLKLSEYDMTPYDNEDPVWFGFEIILNVQTSPLLNGELEKFITQFNLYEEIGSRENIINQFKNEIRKYFKMSGTLDQSNSFDPTKNIFTDSVGNKNSYQAFSNDSGKRLYYVKKVTGLDKLVEANKPNEYKSFVDYGKDNLTITFYEDTSLNLGTLASLYKLLYWSRLRGKNLIPENLLRFDCEIIVSELRDFVRLRKSGSNMLEFLKDNLTRYRYQLYECQLWFDRMSHPDSIDMYEITETNSYDVQLSFKYSNMIFEKYNPDSISDYIRLRNSTPDPLATSSMNSKVGEVNLGQYDSLANGATVSISPIEDVANPTSGQLINSLKQNQKQTISNLIAAPNVVSNPGNAKDDIYGRAADQLVENLKKAALKEAQRQLNIRFRLLNNTIDNIRNAFGIGRIPAPTNVYFPQQNGGPYGNSQFFFDVQNSLRNFGGDTLTGLIGGG